MSTCLSGCVILPVATPQFALGQTMAAPIRTAAQGKQADAGPAPARAVAPPQTQPAQTQKDASSPFSQLVAQMVAESGDTESAPTRRRRAGFEAATQLGRHLQRLAIRAVRCRQGDPGSGSAPRDVWRDVWDPSCGHSQCGPIEYRQRAAAIGTDRHQYSDSNRAEAGAVWRFDRTKSRQRPRLFRPPKKPPRSGLSRSRFSK